MNLAALRARLKELRAEAQAIVDKVTAENRTEMSADEKTAFDAAMASAEAVEADISRLERLAAGQARDAEVKPAAAAGQGPQAAAGQNGQGQGGGQRHNAPGDPAASAEGFESFGEFMASVHYRPGDQRLASLYRSAEAMGLNAEQRMDTGVSGGFMVPTQFRNTLLRVENSPAVIRPRANVIPAGDPPDAAITMPALDQTGSGTRDGHTRGGVKVYKVAEGGQKPRTDFALRQITLEPQEFAATLEITDKLLRNWRAASALIEKLFREAIAEQEDYEFIRGNGIGGPLGFLNSAATIRIARTTADTVKYADLLEMLARSRGPVTWGYHRSLLPALASLKDEAGNLIWAYSARDGMPNTLLGRPAVESENNPVAGVFGDLWTADLDKYLVKDGSGPFVASSEHVKFEENKTVFKVFYNVDAQPWLTGPLTDENGYQSSPFVGLDVPEG